MKDGPLFTPFTPFLERAKERARQGKRAEAEAREKVVSINSRRQPAAEAGSVRKKDA